MHEIEQRFTVEYGYPVCFTRDALDPANPCLRKVLARAGSKPHKVLPVIDSEVLRRHPQLIEQLRGYARAHADLLQLVAAPLVVRGGEVCKSEPVEVDEFHTLTQVHGVCRHSFALVIGGGSVIDAIGFAAATAHRGIRLIRMPTTVLGQNDAGVGVKNAINYRGRKNYLGTFAAPYAVVNDLGFLCSLSTRDRRAGMAEAVKVALIKDKAFFDWLHGGHQRLAAFEDEAVERMVTRCAELHLQHIREGGDPFEHGSARPLDFGHWSAHRLEEMSQSGLRHGEAVAIGIALDSAYSQAEGLITEEEFQRIVATLRSLGFALYDPALGDLNIARALNDFREHLGGELCITLLAGIGRGIEVDHIHVPRMTQCVRRLRALA